MISAISPTSFNTPNFTGRKYYRIAKTVTDQFCSAPQLDFAKQGYNFSLVYNSRPVEQYTGPMLKTAGFSTEASDIGGGWLKASVDTPLSTTGVYTCAVLNLVNSKTAEHVLYHVYHKTNAEKIEKFIREIFPDFTHVNIVGGEQFQTVNTMRKIIRAVDNVDPYAPKIYYHTMCEKPQLVAYQGNIYYIKNKSGQLSFTPNAQNYWY